jgi:hypothetical protein
MPKITGANDDGKLVILRAGNLQKRMYTYQQLPLISESSYRRGFTHGVIETISAVEEHCSLGRIRSWCNWLMNNWWLKNHQGKLEYPPSIFEVN